MILCFKGFKKNLTYSSGMGIRSIFLKRLSGLPNQNFVQIRRSGSVTTFMACSFTLK